MISRLYSPSAESGAAPKKFEVLLERLEQIVSEMENAEMPLEKLLSSYEEGMKLVKTCGERLTEAEQKVEILSKAAKVETPVVEEVPDEEKPEDEEEIRLF